MATNGSNRAVAGPQNDPNSFAASVKDAAMAGFLVAVLGFFFIGIRTDIAPGGLDLKMRWGAWIVSILVVFVGRLLLNLFVLKTDSPITRKIAGAMPSGSRFAGTGK